MATFKLSMSTLNPYELTGANREANELEIETDHLLSTDGEVVF